MTMPVLFTDGVWIDSHLFEYFLFLQFLSKDTRESFASDANPYLDNNNQIIIQ